MNKCNNCIKTTHRDDEVKHKLNKRLKTIEGQIRGIEGMIDEDKYCYDILIQLLAINKSIKSLSTEILKNHLETCVLNELSNNNTEVIDEVMNLIGRF
jgi:DNA-binding FrmR family transcriptional regulator